MSNHIVESRWPWECLEQRILPRYTKAGRGRRPYPLSMMLRVDVVHMNHNLSAPAMEDPRLHGGRLCCTWQSLSGGSRA